MLQGYTLEIEENRPSVWIIFGFLELAMKKVRSLLINTPMNLNFVHFLRVKAVKSSACGLHLCDIVAELAEVFYISSLPMSSFLLVLKGEWGIITLNLCCCLLR